MKRTSILATLLATGLLGIAALGASSASADVLCSDVAFDYNCPTEKTYGVGAEFHADNHGAFRLEGGTKKTVNLVTCGDSNMDMTVTDAGGSAYNEHPEVDMTNLTFSSCGDDSISVVSDGTGVITTLSIGSGSQQGFYYPSGLQIKATTNWLYPYGTGECTYEILGRGTLAGAKTDESGITKIVFTEALAELVSSSGLGCGPKVRFSGQYDFELYPEGIYVLPQ
jgi:hypothetical protein